MMNQNASQLAIAVATIAKTMSGSFAANRIRAEIFVHQSSRCVCRVFIMVSSAFRFCQSREHAREPAHMAEYPPAQERGNVATATRSSAHAQIRAPRFPQEAFRWRLFLLATNVFCLGLPLSLGFLSHNALLFDVVHLVCVLLTYRCHSSRTSLASS